MCGINGIALSGRSGETIDVRVLEEMRDCIWHRGPDDSGLFFNGRVGLGHRRLAIVDVAAGHQPMTNEDGSLQIIYNGEVYNHSDHRPGLEARGRLGIKPLYYAHTEDGSLYFASEIKALLEAGAVRAELNYAALPDYLANHAPSGEETLYRGVRRLLPGHTLLWRDGELKVERYWDVSFAGENGS